MTETVDALDVVAERTTQDAFSRALTNLKGTFSFERKVNLGNYESTTATCFVQFDFDPSADDEEFLGSARQAAERASAIVYEKLGIEAERDAGGILREVVTSFPGAVVEAQAGAAQRPSTPIDGVGQSHGVDPTPPYSKAQIDGLEGDVKRDAMRENNEWAEARFATNPQEFTDFSASNREKGWTSPDYKHKVYRHVGFWKNKK